MQLKDYAWYWYETYRKAYLRRTTQMTMESILRSHLEEEPIGGMDVSEVRTKDLQEYLTHLRLYGNKGNRKGNSVDGGMLSPHVVGKVRQILIAIFEQALMDEIVQRNYARETKPVHIPWKEKPFFNVATQKKFLKRLKGHRFYPAYVMLFYLGLRRSEVLGLRWEDVDLRQSLIHVRRVLVIEDGELVLHDAGKTEMSTRTIPIPHKVKTLLSEWKKRQNEERKAKGYHNDEHLVFTNKDGTPHNPGYFTKNFKKMVLKLNFCDNRLHVHSTRHSWATNMIQCNVPITDIQALGGWSRPDTLLNIYAHTVQDSHKKAINRLSKVLDDGEDDEKDG